MGKQYDMTFQLDARLGGGYSSAFKGAQSAMQQYREEYVRVSSELKNISGYERQQQAVSNTKAKLELLQQQHDKIQQEIVDTGDKFNELGIKLIDNKEQTDKATQALQRQEAQLEQYKQKLKEARVNTDDLKNESSRLKTEMDDLRKKIDESGDGADDFGESLTNLESLIATLGLTKMLKEAYAWFSECVSAAMEFEQAMAGVKRTVGGDDDFLSDLGDSFKEMSTTVPITTTELGTIAETAGQLGIAQELVEEFTLVMAELGTTTDLAADEAATMLAQFANITGITDYERLGSVVAALGDATATTASKVVEMSLGMAASASIAGMSERDILAIAAAVGSLGIESAAGSTAMSQLISTLYKATETGEKLEEIAAISGMSAEEFTTAWGTDAVGAMNTFIQGLTDVERNGKSAIVLLDELGINNVRQVKAILSLAQAGGLLSSTIEQANAAWDENTALGQKASVMYGTTQSKLVMMQNAYANVKTAVGDQFTPALAKVYEILTPILNGISTFISEHSKVTKAIIAIGAGLGAFVVVLGTLVVAIKLVKKALVELKLVVESSSWLLPVSIITGVVVALGTLAATTAAATEEEEKLCAVSQEEQQELMKLEAEYKAVCEAQGETSADAQLLKKQLDEQTEAFERNKQTVEEFSQELNETLASYQEMCEQSEETIESIDLEYDSTLNLIERLDELTSAEYRSAEAKTEILAIVDLLNERLPELGLNYDSLTGRLSMTPEEVIEYATQSYEQESNAAKWTSLKERLGQRQTLKDAMDDAEVQYNAALKEYEEAEEESRKAQEAFLNNPQSKKKQDLASKRFNIAQEKKAAYETAKADYDTAYNAYYGNENAIGDLSRDLAGDHPSLQDFDMDAAAAEIVMGGTIDGLIESLDALAESYNAVYEAAYDSIHGQFSMWSEVKDIEAASIEELTKSQKDQIAYWEAYNQNLQLLRGRGFEGVDELLAYMLEEGMTGESIANVIAGLVESSDEEVEDFIASWRERAEMEKEASEGLTQYITGYDEAVKEMTQGFIEATEDLALPDAARQEAYEMIMAYIGGAEDLLPGVEAAFSNVAAIAADALKRRRSTGSALDDYYSNPPPIGSFEGYGFATGTSSARRGWHMTGENGPELMYFYGGERVFTASETRDMLREYQAATTGAYLAEPIEAASAQSYGGVTVHFAPVYDISGTNDAEELRQVLAAHDEQLLQQLWELLAEERENAQRRAYR